MPENFDKSEIIGKPLGRSAVNLTRELTVDEDSRTVAGISLTSDQPIFHWFGYVILDHSAESIRLDRFNAGAPMLWAHSHKEQIGAWENVRVDKGKLRADAKFSRGVQGSEKFQDVQDGICRSISAGFYMWDLEPELDKKGNQRTIGEVPVFRCNDWEPFEASLEPTPADITVGVGRSIDEKVSSATERNSTKEDNRTMADPIIPTPAPAADPAPAPVEQRSADTTVMAEITQWGTALGAEEFTRNYLATADGPLTLEAFRAALKAQTPATIQPPAPDPATAAARQGAGTELAVVGARGALRSFRGPNAREDAYRAGMWVLAQFGGHEAAQRYCESNGIKFTRTMSGRDNAKGGVFVIPEIESAIIDLRIEYGVLRRNANVVQMNSETKWVPRRVSGLTAYPVGPGQSGTYSDVAYDQVELVARKWMVLTKIEDELEEDAVISFVDKFADEAAYAMTYAEDRVGFLGTGLSTDHGIVGIIPKITAATASIVTAAGNTFAEVTEANLLSMIGKLPQFARRSGRNKWYGSNVFWAEVLARLAFAKGGVTYTEISGQIVPTFMGYPYETVEVMPVTDVNSQIPLLFGNMSQAVTFGDRRGITVKMADENDKDFEKDLTTMKATERFDLNAHDVGSTTVAGPLIALQMAGS